MTTTPNSLAEEVTMLLQTSVQLQDAIWKFLDAGDREALSSAVEANAVAIAVVTRISQ